MSAPAGPVRLAHDAAQGGAGTPLRRLLVGVLLAYLAFVIYGSLVPLHFQPMPLAQAWARFQQTPMLTLGAMSRADLVANLLLFVPLSFLMREVGTGVRPPGLVASTALWLVCVGLAVGIEFTQEFFPGRTVSLNDLSAESAGAALGLLLHGWQGTAVRRWLAGWWSVEQGLPFASRLLHGYLVALLVFAMMPLDLTISPVELYHKMREGRIRLNPLSELGGEPMQVAYNLITDLLVWLPVGALWRLAGHPPGRVLLRGLLLAALLEGLQLFVYTRVTSTADVLTGGLGCAIGALCLQAGWQRGLGPLSGPSTGRSTGGATGRTTGQSPRPVPEPTHGRPGDAIRPLRAVPWAWLSLAWAVLVLAAFWYPYHAVWSLDYLAERWLHAMRVPFESLYMGSEYHALNELLRKMLMFLPGGLLWSGHVAQAQPWQRTRHLYLGALVAPALALLVEAGQLLLPGKVADLTDVVLQASGAWLGLALGRRLWGLSPPRPAAPVSGQGAAATPMAPAAGPAGPAWADLAAVLLLAVLLWSLARLPGVPYNVKELLAGTLKGAGTAVAVAAVAWWLLTLPLLLQGRWRGRPEHAMRLALWLPLLGLPPGLLLLLFAPRESLDDIVGSPVLDGPGWLESLGRYMALHGALALAATGAVWLVARVASDRRIGLLPGWFVAATLWALPLHAVVVTWAATDNLTELMRGGGNPAISLLLFAGVFALLTTASSLAAALVHAGYRGRLLVLALLAWPAALAALWLGSEPALFKYGQAFSAAQFLLSPDRSHYVSGTALLARFTLACVALVVIVALLQLPRWHRLRAR